jgi:hypothetical protein
MKTGLLAAILIVPLLVGSSSLPGRAAPLPPYDAELHAGSPQAEPVAMRHRGTTVARGPRGWNGCPSSQDRRSSGRSASTPNRSSWCPSRRSPGASNCPPGAPVG